MGGMDNHLPVCEEETKVGLKVSKQLEVGVFDEL